MNVSSSANGFNSTINDGAPEVLARGMIHDSHGRLLLVRHRRRDWWFAPGGHLERGESVSVALQRELQEEAELPLMAQSVRVL
ncbi:NUDIX hydrolase [Devriesea agamarum]|uniref:NUDIX hydrolase n=1 Tax=Devriesea agamarum TaxID=472569 RepID=UPI0009FFA7DC